MSAAPWVLGPFRAPALKWNESFWVWESLLVRGHQNFTPEGRLRTKCLNTEQVRTAACWIISSLPGKGSIGGLLLSFYQRSHFNQWTVVRINLAIMGWINKFDSTSSLLEMYCGLQIGTGRTESVPPSQICDLNSPPMASPNPKMGLWKSTLLF